MPKMVNHDERKVFIAEAAFRTIKHHGIENTTLRKVAEEAGFSLGSIQYYFPTQRDLFIFSMEVIEQRALERIVGSVQDGDPALEGVVSMLKPFIPSSDPDQRVEIESWLSLSLMAIKEPELAQISLNLYQKTLEFMTLMITILQNNGLMNDGIHVDSEAKNLFAFIDGLTLQAILYPGIYDNEMIENRIKNYVLNICGRKP